MRVALTSDHMCRMTLFKLDVSSTDEASLLTNRKLTLSKYLLNYVNLCIIVIYTYPCFLLHFLFCLGFLTFWNTVQTISGPQQIKFKFPDFSGFLAEPCTQIPVGSLF